MKVKIKCKQENYNEFKKMFEAYGFEVSNDAEYYFEQIEYNFDTILSFDDRGDSYFIKLNEVYIIQANDYKNTIILKDGTSKYINEKLYEFEDENYREVFLRVNKSQLVNVEFIRKVSPVFNSRLKLTLSNYEVVYVSRTYLHKFRDLINRRRK